MTATLTNRPSPAQAHPVSPITLRAQIRQTLLQYFTQLDGAQPTNLYEMVFAEVELPLLQFVMEINEGNQSKAAEQLGISRGTLRKKLKHYQLES